MKGSYFIPRTFTTWDLDDPAIVDFPTLLDAVKSAEGVKRVPPTWKIWLHTEKGMIEMNRRATARQRAEKIYAAKHPRIGV